MQVTSRSSSFEDLLLCDSPPPSHLVSQIYSILSSLSHSSLPVCTSTWERELAMTFNSEDWEKAFILSHKFSFARSAQEKNFKILTHWKKCPDILHHFYLSLPSVCWRCQGLEGIMTHTKCLSWSNKYMHIF